MKGYLYTESCAHYASNMFTAVEILENRFGSIPFLKYVAEACAPKQVVEELTRLHWTQFCSHIQFISMGKSNIKLAESSPTAPTTWPLYTNNQEDNYWRQKHGPVIHFNESTNYFEVRLPVPQLVFNHDDDRGNVRNDYTLSQMKQGALRLRQNKKGEVTTILELHVPLHLKAPFKEQKEKAVKTAMIKARVLHAQALLWEVENLR